MRFRHIVSWNASGSALEIGQGERLPMSCDRDWEDQWNSRNWGKSRRDDRPASRSLWYRVFTSWGDGLSRKDDRSGIDQSGETGAAEPDRWM